MSSGVLRQSVDLSVIIPAFHEGDRLAAVIPELNRTLDTLGVTHEILVATRDRDAATIAAVERAGARLVTPVVEGYGAALSAGWSVARGEYVLTMDADLAQPPTFVRTLWEARRGAARRSPSPRATCRAGRRGCPRRDGS